MPYIRVELLKGRSPEQKKELAKALTETYARVFETWVDGIHVTFDERDDRLIGNLQLLIAAQRDRGAFGHPP